MRIAAVVLCPSLVGPCPSGRDGQVLSVRRRAHRRQEVLRRMWCAGAASGVCRAANVWRCSGAGSAVRPAGSQRFGAPDPQCAAPRGPDARVCRCGAARRRANGHRRHASNGHGASHAAPGVVEPRRFPDPADEARRQRPGRRPVCHDGLQARGNGRSARAGGYSGRLSGCREHPDARATHVFCGRPRSKFALRIFSAACRTQRGVARRAAYPIQRSRSLCRRTRRVGAILPSTRRSRSLCRRTRCSSAVPRSARSLRPTVARVCAGHARLGHLVQRSALPGHRSSGCGYPMFGALR